LPANTALAALACKLATAIPPFGTPLRSLPGLLFNKAILPVLHLVVRPLRQMPQHVHAGRVRPANIFGLPLSRWSARDLTREAQQSGLVASISGSTLWRWLLSQSALESIAETGSGPSLPKSHHLIPKDVNNVAIRLDRVLSTYSCYSIPPTSNARR